MVVEYLLILLAFLIFVLSAQIIRQKVINKRAGYICQALWCKLKEAHKGDEQLAKKYLSTIIRRSAKKADDSIFSSCH